jgi:hypothetical protein
MAVLKNFSTNNGFEQSLTDEVESPIHFPNTCCHITDNWNGASKHASDLVYVQVTVHRDKLRIKQPTRCIIYPKLYFVIKLYMFRASSVPIIRSYLLYTRQLVRFMRVM